MSVWKYVLKKLKPWMAPGNDAVQGYWWKQLPSAAGTLHLLYEKVLSGEVMPQWAITGRMVLIPKTETNSEDPAKYRPIACLTVMYKLYTAVLAERLAAQVERHSLIPPEQMALRRGKSGCMEALMIDLMISEDAKVMARDLAVAWVDYRKAFDSVCHKWLEHVLREMHVPEVLRRSIA